MPKQTISTNKFYDTKTRCFLTEVLFHKTHCDYINHTFVHINLLCGTLVYNCLLPPWCHTVKRRPFMVKESHHLNVFLWNLRKYRWNHSSVRIVLLNSFQDWSSGNCNDMYNMLINYIVCRPLLNLCSLVSKHTGVSILPFSLFFRDFNPI